MTEPSAFVGPVLVYADGAYECESARVERDTAGWPEDTEAYRVLEAMALAINAAVREGAHR